MTGTFDSAVNDYAVDLYDAVDALFDSHDAP